MSGVSLAVAPRTEPEPTTAAPAEEKKKTTPPGVSGVMGSLRVIELQLVAFIMVFSASGLVPLLDLLFPVFASAYLLLLARLAFPSCSHSATAATTSRLHIVRETRYFRFYVVLGTTVGLFLPLSYVLGGFARGDDNAVRSATPHLFLLSCQILTENLIGGLTLFSPPVRALVPLLYTVRRIFVVLDWVTDVWINKKLPANANIQDVAWLWFGKVLAVANLAYFSVNLFAFLIPRFLPRAFEQYLNQRDNNDEVAAKMAEDKRPSADESAANEAKKSD
ncbi:hypothetical protein H6P81_012081 [Aristolochia fimbriata]|uniref:DUF7733 domain-containing protein n=1 Tax=Aristolochia fimbriata TaxID=158543 RepID=A0AAV7EFE2_ARIFI|nr:hypothetical protein H6P81_012081 [Aristolochia fimbriata]